MTIRGLLVLSAPALAACGSSAGAVGRVSISHVCSIPTPDESGACVTPVQCAPLAGAPTLDSEHATGDFTLLIEFDNTKNPGDLSNTWLGYDDALVEELYVAYTGVDLPPFTFFFPYRSVDAPGVGSATAYAITLPSYYLPYLPRPGRIGMALTALGHYESGVPFTTDELQVPVEVCLGCTPDPATACPAGQKPVVCPVYGQTNAIACY
ncbi:MAG TPA: hypothetical protein VMT17_11855 [Anaeromyxobacteraceae bacterium]|nr:hypothetical protein [Anaeromyxobacteraceae bacterium]